MKKKRSIYIILSLALFVLELCIALFVRDRFIRPYGGDILVTLLLCCIVNSITVDRFRPLPFAVFAFSVCVEIGQYFNYAELLGLSKYKVFRVLLGSSFSVADIFCYAAGCILFVIGSTLISKVTKER